MMDTLRSILGNAASAAEKNAVISEHDYIIGGLLYCGACRTPKQCRVNILGSEMTIFCDCKCRQEQLAAEESEAHERKQADRIGRLKKQGIQDKQIQGWTFAADDGGNPAMMDKAARYYAKWPLIVTTNLTLDEIKNPANITYSRIYDRILEICAPIHFAGESRRRAVFQSKLDRVKTIFREGEVN